MADEENLAGLLAEFTDGDAQFGDVDDAALKGIAEAARKRQELAETLDEAEALVGRIKAAIRKIDEVRLPELMLDAGTSEFSLDDGSKIKLKDEVYCSMIAAQKEAAIEWLQENGHGSIVKHIIGCQFGKDEDAEALRLKHMLSEAGFKFSDDQSVHANTLKSWAREEVEAGRMPPGDLFHTHEAKVAKITAPRKSRGK